MTKCPHCQGEIEISVQVSFAKTNKECFSTRAKEIKKLSSQGFTCRQIGYKLGCSPSTVSRVLTRLSEEETE